MTLEQLSWYRRQYRRQAAAVGPGHGRGQPQRRRRPRDPGHPRSGARCSRSASPPSQVNQQLRQVNINAAGGRAEIAGSRAVGARARQCRRRLSARRRPRSRSAAAARSGSRDIAEVRDLYAEQRSYREDQRPAGAQLRHPARQGRVRRHRLSTAAMERAAASSRSENPSVHFEQLFNCGRIYRGAISNRRWRR